MRRQSILLLAIVVLFGVANIASATITQGIDIEFVIIGNAGNPADSTGYGAVGYEYHIGKYEVTNGQWDAFVSAAGAPTGNDGGYSYDARWTGTDVSTNNVSWYEAVQFCNYLTSGDKSLGAYLFSGDNTDPGDFLGINRSTAIAIYGTVYVLPTEDEWHKAAYYTGSGYSLYSNGLSTVPPADNGWNYSGGSYDSPWDVGTGTMEQNGTFDMMANVREWNETLKYHDLYRGNRGGSYCEAIDNASSLCAGHYDPVYEHNSVGFRVVKVVPTPSAIMFGTIGAGFVTWLRIRRALT